MARNSFKNCSKSLTVIVMHIKMNLRFQFKPVWMTKIKKSTAIKYWQGCGAKGTLIHCWWDCKMMQFFYMQPSSFSRTICWRFFHLVYTFVTLSNYLYSCLCFPFCLIDLHVFSSLPHYFEDFNHYTAWHISKGSNTLL